MATPYRVSGSDIMKHDYGFAEVSGRDGDCFLGPSRGQGARRMRYDYASTCYSYIAGIGTADTDAFVDNVLVAWNRFYVYFHTYPDAASGDGEVPICTWHTSHWASPTVVVTVDSVGTMRAWSQTGTSPITYELLCESAAGVVPLGRWVRIETRHSQNSYTTQAPPNPPYISDAEFDMKVEGNLVASYAASGGDPGQIGYGIHEQGTGGSITISMFAVYIGRPHYSSYPGTALVGGEYSYDDCAYGVDGWLGNGWCLDILPTSIAADGWGLTAGVDDECVLHDHRVYYPATGATSATALDTLTFNLPTLRSKGITTPTRFAQINAYGNFSQTAPGMQVGIRINGGAWSDYDICVVSGGSKTYFAIISETIQPDDTVQLRIIKDNNTTSRTLNQICLTVEVQAKSAYVSSNAVQVKMGSYTGNGTQQRIDMGGFVPDMVMVVPVTYAVGYSPGPTVNIFSKNSEGNSYIPWNTMNGLMTNPNFVRFDDDGFVIRGGASTINESGRTFSVIGIKDPSMSVFFRDWWFYSGDPMVYKLHKTSYLPDTVIINPTRMAGAGSAQLFVGPSNTAGHSTLIDSIGNDDIVDLLLVNGPGELEYGTAVPASAISTISCVLAFREYVVNNYTVATFNYTGNGTNSATISFPAPYNTMTPVAVIVVETTDLGVSAGQIKTSHHASTDASDFWAQSVRNNVSMGAMGTGYITAGTDNRYINVNGGKYTVIAFFEATDGVTRTTSTTDPDPDPEAAGPGPCAGEWGCDWSPTSDEWSFTWPDLVEGLLGVNFGLRRYNSANVPMDKRTAKVACEQRTFPIAADQFEFNVPCDQRTFDALQEYP